MLVLSNDELRIIIMSNCKELGKKIDEHIQGLRGNTKSYCLKYIECFL